MTTTPNEALRDLHDRMPVVIPEDRLGPLARRRPRIPGELLALLVPDDELDLTIYPVVRDVNDVRRDGPGLIEPLLPVGG